MSNVSNENANSANQFLIDPNVPSNVFFAVKESYKTIRANIMLSLVKDETKRLVVTSSIPGEGKTTTSINLAISLSQADKKVLLVDVDLRKNRIGKYLRLQHKKGLTDIIREDITFDEVVNKTKFPNLHILASGTQVMNPSEVLASKLTDNFLNSLNGKYDYIILDAPPINVVSDALPLIKNSDGVLFVARENVVTQKELKKAISALTLIKANILGLIYIGRDSTHPYYRSRYGKYDNYGYYDEED